MFVFGVILFLIIFGTILYITFKNKIVKVATVQNNTYVLNQNDTINDTSIRTEIIPSFSHTLPPSIEPMTGMTNPSTGAVMVNSLVDSTGHAYSM